ncbi:hypothetical protein KEM52_002913 [Ascosphaera acerosa]|nr:hypothetical protein KEM52_002913 [Ascosphaera acerosa]
MAAILEEDRRWRDTLRARLLRPRAPRDADAVVRREDELDAEDERLYDVGADVAPPLGRAALRRLQLRRRSEDAAARKPPAAPRRMPVPRALRAIEARLERLGLRRGQSSGHR